ncbi:MAG: hypothetical protein ACTSPB_05430 [Candidatus Thorarchaeota archaeon]
MNHMKPIENDNKERIIRERLSDLDTIFKDWMNEFERGNTILTKGEIEGLYTLAEKNFKFLSRKQGLNDNQRKTKEYVHKKMGNAILDLSRMATYGFIGTYTEWNPNAYNPNLDSLPYKIETWHDEFPVYHVSNFIRALVMMFGDEYALPIAEAIERGLKGRPENINHSIEVPIIKKLSSFL